MTVRGAQHCQLPLIHGGRIMYECTPRRSACGRLNRTCIMHKAARQACMPTCTGHLLLPSQSALCRQVMTGLCSWTAKAMSCLARRPEAAPACPLCLLLISRDTEAQVFVPRQRDFVCRTHQRDSNPLVHRLQTLLNALVRLIFIRTRLPHRVQLLVQTPDS